MEQDRAAVILVADDDPAIRTLVSHQLHHQGYTVLQACDGHEALAILQAEPVDVLLSDWMMPDMDGLTLCRAVKQNPDLASIYVIMLTALNAPDDIVKGLDAGADDYLSKPFRAIELGARIRSGLRILRMQRDLARKNRELEELASTDPLTGTRNRLGIEGALAHIVEQHRIEGWPLSVALFDLDHFKQVNDRCGHPTGDALLRAVADLTRSQIRHSDLFGRLGGDEFILILCRTPLASAVACAERIRNKIEQKFSNMDFAAEGSGATVSIGLITWQPNGATVDESMLIAAADKALYEAKRRGGNQVVSHNLTLPLIPPDKVPTHG